MAEILDSAYQVIQDSKRTGYRFWRHPDRCKSNAFRLQWYHAGPASPAPVRFLSF